jgi:hypothetical protein
VPTVDIICLANSYKLDHRCIAGLRTDGSAWIRPVTEREHGELEYRHYRLQDQSEPGVLDVIRIGLSNPHPLPHQPENWRLDKSPWELIERPAGGERARIVVGSVSENPLLFGNSGKSVLQGQFQQRPAKESLVLVEPNDIAWLRRDKARVLFRLENFYYDLPLTDPCYVGPLKRLAPGSHRSTDLGIPDNRKILFTISLGELLDGICYKLVAAVVVAPLAWHSLFE